MKLWSVLGNSQRLDGGAMFGNVPRALWSRWLPPDEQHRVPLACRALLVQLPDGRRVLLETGIGAFFPPELRERFGVVESEHVLLNNLEHLGLSDADIDLVILSHLHFDHVGGLLAPWREGEPARLLFPKARFLIGQEAWERARDPHPRDRASFIPELMPLLEASGRVELVTGERHALLGELARFEFSQGHTPGLMLTEIAGVVFCADLIPGRPWVHLPVTMGYDRFPELLIDEKRSFLEDKAARGVRLFFTHDPDCALATPVRDAKGRWSADSPVAELVAVAA